MTMIKVCATALATHRSHCNSCNHNCIITCKRALWIHEGNLSYCSTEELPFLICQSPALFWILITMAWRNKYSTAEKTHSLKLLSSCHIMWGSVHCSAWTSCSLCPWLGMRTIFDVCVWEGEAFTKMTVYITCNNQIDTKWSKKRMRWKAEVPICGWHQCPSLPSVMMMMMMVISPPPHPLIAFSDQWGREKERKRERERSVYFQPHADSCAATPRTCSYPEKHRESKSDIPPFSASFPLQTRARHTFSRISHFQLCFPSFCCCGFYTVLVVAFPPCLWNERVSCLRRFHVSMGTAVSKRKNLRNDAISSVAAKVRWVTPGALRIWTRYMEASVRLGRYLSFQVPPNRSYPCVTVQFPLRFPGTASPSL